MASRDLFSEWTLSQLQDYITENGGDARSARSREDLITEAARLAAKSFTGRDLAPPVPPPMPPAGGGTRKALIVGINYRGTSSQLGGCINDAKCMEFLLRTKFGFRPENILFMTDDQSDPLRLPTRHNMFMGFTWLMTGVKPGDSLVFHYSGHGSQQRDYSGDELDGMNETLCPLDYKRAGEIVDDELNRQLVNPVPKGAKLHAIVDACHSGSVMDLPYSTRVVNGRLEWRSEYARPTRAYKGTAGGFAVQIGAALDSQTAADTTKLSGYTSTGAATYAFIQAIEQRGTTMTYGDLILCMDSTLHHALGSGGGGGGLSPAMMGGGALGGLLGGMLMGNTSNYQRQQPQLSCTWTFDLGYKFSL